MTSWTLILSELEADEETIVALRRQLLDQLSKAGYKARTVTVQTFVYRENVKPPEPFQTGQPPSTYQGPRATLRQRKNKGAG